MGVAVGAAKAVSRVSRDLTPRCSNDSLPLQDEVAEPRGASVARGRLVVEVQRIRVWRASPCRSIMIDQRSLRLERGAVRLLMDVSLPAARNSGAARPKAWGAPPRLVALVSPESDAWRLEPCKAVARGLLITTYTEARPTRRGKTRKTQHQGGWSC